MSQEVLTLFTISDAYRNLRVRHSYWGQIVGHTYNI